MSTIDNVGQSIATIFDRVCEHLRSKPEHTARIASGPAAEQWFLPEIRAVLNWSRPSVLGLHEWAVIQSRKRDLVVFSDVEATAPECWPASHVIQVKLLSSTDAPHNLRSKVLVPLRDRVFASRADESENTRRSVLIFAVWDSWGSFYPGFDGFRRSLGGEFRSVFGLSDFLIGGEEIPAVLGPISLDIAGRPLEVRIAGTWIAAHVPHRYTDFLPSEIEEAARRAADRGPSYTKQQVFDHLRSLDHR